MPMQLFPNTVKAEVQIRGRPSGEEEEEINRSSTERLLSVRVLVKWHVSKREGQQHT